MPRSEREPRRSTVTTLACVCGLAVTSLAADAQPHSAAVPLALPDVTAHPPLPQDFPLPTGQRDAPPSETTSSIGARLNRIVQLSSSEAQASPGIALDDGTIPQQALAAYRRAADILSRRDPSCRLHWSVLAGIGRIESGHARGGALFSDGRTASPILGPRLDGSLAGTATIRDSTGGQFDGDPVWERAVGPMQFLPSTWLQYGQDGNGDGARDPHNVYDAALGSAVYLCAGARDLAAPSQLNQALFSYNPSLEYVRAVLAWADHYAGLGPQPGAGRTVTHTLAMSRDADGTGERKPDDEPAQHPEPPKPVPPTTPPKSPGQGSDADNDERAGNGTSKPDTDQNTESTEDAQGTAESPAAPSDVEGGQGDDGPDEPDSPDTAEPSEPSEPEEPAEPTEPTEPDGADDPTCEQPDDTDGSEDGEETNAEDGAGDTEDADGGDGDNKAEGSDPQDGSTDDSGRSDEADVSGDDATDDGAQDDAERDGDEGSDGTCEQPDGDGENDDRGGDNSEGDEDAPAPTTSVKPSTKPNDPA